MRRLGHAVACAVLAASAGCGGGSDGPGGRGGSGGEGGGDGYWQPSGPSDELESATRDAGPIPRVDSPSGLDACDMLTPDIVAALLPRGDDIEGEHLRSSGTPASLCQWGARGSDDTYAGFVLVTVIQVRNTPDESRRYFEDSRDSLRSNPDFEDHGDIGDAQAYWYGGQLSVLTSAGVAFSVGTGGTEPSKDDDSRWAEHVAVPAAQSIVSRLPR